MQEHSFTPAESAREAARLEALKRYRVLDTLPEAAFDRIARLAAVLFRTPIALVSFVDAERQWFKARHGVEETEMPRHLAFCAHAIMQSGVMVVPNAARDPRFTDNPLVTGAHHVRFYAAAPLKTADQHALGTICVIDYEPRPPLSRHEQAALEDLAALVIDELELRQMGHQAMLASQAKSAFLANISHEIRAPINAILSFATLLKDTTLSDEQQEYVHTIRHGGEIMLGLVNDVLDIAKIEAGRLDLEQIPFNVAELTDEVAQLFRLQARAKGLSLLRRCKALPAMYFIGDPHRLRQVLMNLVSNAVKFTHTGCITLSVTFRPKDRTLQFCVKDTGIGIARENIGRIFEDFVQEDFSVTRQYGGTGLGLAISRRLLECMESGLTVTSVQGKGAAFRFALSLPMIEGLTASPPMHETGTVYGCEAVGSYKSPSVSPTERYTA